MKEKLEAFARKLEADKLEQLKLMKVDCEANRINCKVTIRPGKKYTKVDIGRSGAYMVVNDTGQIFGIKAYGVIHKGHCFGNIEDAANRSWIGR